MPPSVQYWSCVLFLNSSLAKTDPKQSYNAAPGWIIIIVNSLHKLAIVVEIGSTALSKLDTVDCSAEMLEDKMQNNYLAAQQSLNY